MGCGGLGDQGLLAARSIAGRECVQCHNTISTVPESKAAEIAGSDLHRLMAHVGREQPICLNGLSDANGSISINSRLTPWPRRRTWGRCWRERSIKQGLNLVSADLAHSPMARSPDQQWLCSCYVSLRVCRW